MELERDLELWELARGLLLHGSTQEDILKIRAPQTPPPSSIDSLFARALAKAKRRTTQLIGGPALAGAVMVGGMASCIDAPDIGMAEQADWVTDEGVANTEMVKYFGHFWAECANPNTRFGCGSIDVTLKLRVKPVAGANLNYKEVGVVYKNPFDQIERTAYGYYFTTWDNGYEEWHVPVSMPTWRDFFTFNALYRDGAYHTYFDDNRGELHAINAGPDQQIVRVNTYSNTVAVSAEGVRGKVSLRVADLDYDKKIRMFCTVDGWSNELEFAMGQAGQKNVWYWVQDVYGGEIWEIDLDLAGGDIYAFEYAVQYQHGVVNDATEYGFWANNNGNNYRVVRTVVD